MKIHRYFFWIEDNFIEIYKDGKLERYDGEDRTYIDNLENFWKKWESNSRIMLSDEKIDFTFLVDEKTDRENLLNSIEKYNYEIDLSPEFSSEDLKKILDIKNIKKVIFNYNNEEITIDNNHIVAWSTSLDYDIHMENGFWQSIGTGEGLVNTFRGTGEIYVQSLNPITFAEIVSAGNTPS